MTLEDAIRAGIAAELGPLRTAIERCEAKIDAFGRRLPPMWMPLREAIKRMGDVSYKTGLRRCESGAWPARKDGGRWFVDLGGLRPMTNEEVARTASKLRAISGGTGP